MTSAFSPVKYISLLHIPIRLGVATLFARQQYSLIRGRRRSLLLVTEKKELESVSARLNLPELITSCERKPQQSLSAELRQATRKLKYK